MGDNVRLWARRTDVPRELAEVDGNYGPVESDEFGGLRVRDQLATNALGAKGDAAKGSAEDGTISARLRQVTALLEGDVATAAAPSTKAIGSSSTQVLAADAARTRVVLTNYSDAPISVGIGATAVVGSGLVLDQAPAAGRPGGTIVLTPSGGCRLVINAICASGTKNLAYHTFTGS